MGQIKKGILGGFSGKVGTIVGANWKNISYMRSLPQKNKNSQKPLTKAQLEHRTKFKLVIDTLKTMTDLINVGWKQATNDKQTPFSTAVKYAMNNSIYSYVNASGVRIFSLIESKLVISRGSLTPPLNARSYSYMSTRRFEWDNNSGVGNAKPTDKAIIVMFNSLNNEAITYIGQATRQAGFMNYQIPASWQKYRIICCLGFVSENGSECSNSVYICTMVKNF